MKMSLQQFSDMMRKKSLRTQSSIVKAATMVRNQLYQRARRNATIYPKRITGNLYNSIRAELRTTNDGLRIDLTAGDNTAFYAKYVEGRTKFLKRAQDSINQTLPEKLRLYLGIYLEEPKYYGDNSRFFNVRE